MTDLEPITTYGSYESAREFARQYEKRIADQQRELNAIEEETIAAQAQITARRREIINNLKTQLWALKAQCHDYELNELKVSEQVEEPKGSWTAEVFSLRDLIQAAALNPEYEQYLQPNQVALNKAARKMKRVMYVPGVIATRKEKS